MKISTYTILIAVLANVLTASGCAYDSGRADTYSRSQAQREATVRFGTVESVRAVTIDASDGQPTGLGALGGGALGAVAGSAIGGGRGSIATAIVGGIAGIVAGSAIENKAANRSGVEITVRLDNGDLRAITQADAGESFQAGQRVRLLSSGGVTRVTH